MRLQQTETSSLKLIRLTPGITGREALKAACKLSDDIRAPSGGVHAVVRGALTDIPPYHIMFDKQKKRLNGIIDFDCAGLGDPAIDFGVIIYNYGESCMDRFYKVYPEAEIYLKRARFYAGAHEVRWLLTGIERNDPWWFAVHVGSAKDMKYD